MPDFGTPCREQMELRAEQMTGDYRLDYGVSTACEGDVAGFCGDAKVALQSLLHLSVFPLSACSD